MTNTLSLHEKEQFQRLPESLAIGLELTDSLAAMVLADPAKHKILAIEEWEMPRGNGTFPNNIPDFLDGIKASYPFLNDSRHRVFAIVDTPKAVLVPQSHYDPFMKEAIVSSHFCMEKYSGWVLADTIEPLDAVNLYVLPLNIENRVKSAFSNIMLFHSDTVYFRNVVNTPGLAAGNIRVFADLSAERILVSIMNGNKLVFYNRVDYRNDDNLVYQLLFALRQNNVSNKTTHPRLSGRKSEDHAFLQKLSAFFPSVAYLETGKTCNTGKAFAKFNFSTRYKLINLVL